LRWLQILAAIFWIALSGSNEAYAQRNQGRDHIWAPKLDGPSPGEIQVLPVQGNVHVLIGAGGNIIVQTGEEGILLVDTGTADMSDKVLKAIASLSNRPLRYIVNTTGSLDHSGGNEKIAQAGEIVPYREPDYTAGPQGALNTHRAKVISFLTVFQRMAEQKPPRPDGAWPDDTFSSPQKRLFFNDEPVLIMHMPGNTDGNSIVLFRKSDVVSTGDLLDLTQYPIIDLQAGGSINAIIESLDRVIDIAVPSGNAAGGTLVIPGHGRISDHAEVVYYRDMITIIRDRIQDMIKRGMTLDQVKAARPTIDYDSRYGNQGGTWTTDKFIEAAYRSLSK
jgi:cyclase